MIAIYINQNQTDWDKHLPMLTAAYRSCVHEKTGYTPNLLMLERERSIFLLSWCLVLLRGQKDAQRKANIISEMRENLSAISQLVRESLKINSPKKDCDPRISFKTYKVGDLVYYRDNTRTVGKSPKLKSQIWKGPCVIIKNLVIYCLK